MPLYIISMKPYGHLESRKDQTVSTLEKELYLMTLLSWNAELFRKVRNEKKNSLNLNPFVKQCYKIDNEIINKSNYICFLYKSDDRRLNDNLIEIKTIKSLQSGGV